MDPVEKFTMICIFLAFTYSTTAWTHCKETSRKTTWNIDKIKEKRITQIEKIKLSINMILCSYASQNNTLV